MLGIRNINLRRGRKKTGGFSLTEIAVIMGIVGLIIGAVWVAGSQVYMSNQMRTTVQELEAISNNIRAEFSEQGGVTDTGAGALTQALDQMRVFPIEMRKNQATPAGVIFDPWSTNPENGLGSVYVDADDCTGAANTAGAPEPCFGITFYDIPRSVCIQLLTSTSPHAAHQGLQAIIVNTVNVGGVPVIASTAETSCESTAVPNPDGTNTMNILWVYSIKSGGT